MNLLKRLWRNEPVIVRTLLALAVSAGVLTAAQAAAWADAVSAVLVALGAVAARSAVSPTAKPDANVPPTLTGDRGAASVDTLLLVCNLIVLLVLLFHGHIH